MHSQDIKIADTVSLLGKAAHAAIEDGVPLTVLIHHLSLTVSNK